MAVCSVAQFDRLWDDAQREASPDPKVAAGALMKTFAEALGVELIAFGKTGPAALFLFDLSKLGFKGMDMNVAMVTHPAVTETENGVPT